MDISTNFVEVDVKVFADDCIWQGRIKEEVQEILKEIIQNIDVQKLKSNQISGNIYQMNYWIYKN